MRRLLPLNTDLALLILRVVLGVIMIYHGWPKLADLDIADFAVVSNAEALNAAVESALEIQLDLVFDVAALTIPRCARSRPPTLGRFAAAKEGSKEIREWAVISAEHLGHFLLGHRPKSAASG